jgi:hypothetical protein
MSENSGIKKLKVALILTVIVNLFYGIAFFVAPGAMSEMAGGTPVEHGWLRWSGGVLIGLAVGGLQAYRNPANQKSLVTLSIWASLMSGLAFAYTLLFENYTIHTWFILVPCVVVFAMFAVMMWARQGAKEILG